MTFETVVLPMAEAVELEAKQNLERDRRLFGENEDLDLDIYREEARHLLTTTGEGYEPAHDDHKLVKVQA